MQTETTPAQADVSELDLVRQCQAGDTEAFDQLVTRYRTRVFAMIYNMVHNEQDAWDLAQESFVKAWKSIGRFRGKSSFYTWIYRIVMNVIIDWLRKRRVKAGEAEFDDAIQLKDIHPASGAEGNPRPDRPCYLPTRSRTPGSKFKERNGRNAVSRNRRKPGLLHRHGDVAPVLCPEEIAEFPEGRL